jgi:hypothetical protein
MSTTTKNVKAVHCCKFWNHSKPDDKQGWLLEALKLSQQE